MDTAKTSRVLSMLVVALGAIVLVGWVFQIDILKRVHPELVTMKANTAVALMLCGIAIALLADEPSSASRRRVAHILAVVFGFIGAMTLSEHLFGWSLGI